MTNDLFNPSTSLFDTYLVYFIVGLILFIGLLGLIVLLTTSCCCFYCYFYSTSCCSCCFRSNRHLSYKLNQYQNNLNTTSKDNNNMKIPCRRRYSSDLTDFSQLYDSCPHLINSRVMIHSDNSMTSTNEHASTLLNSHRTYSSPSSTFQHSGSYISQNLNPTTELNLIYELRQNKAHCPRPFSYVQNTKLNRSSSQSLNSTNYSNPSNVSIQNHQKVGPFDRTQQEIGRSCSPCTNIYETVVPTTTAGVPVSIGDRATPIYETEWTPNVNPILIQKISTMENDPLSVMKLALTSNKNCSNDYFQQQNPYDRILSTRLSTSDSIRRTNILTQLKDDAAFLY